jgi:hypothetical protein
MFKYTIYTLILIFTFSYANESKKPEDVLKRIYPGSNVEIKNLVLNFQQLESIQKLSGVKFDSKLVSIYIVKKGQNIIAYGYVDTHTVRTKPEVVLYTIAPDFKIDVIEVLHFGEPLEYLPEKNWFENFKGKGLDNDGLKLRTNIPNVSGATLTSRAITDRARLAIAIVKTLFGEKNEIFDYKRY